MSLAYRIDPADPFHNLRRRVLVIVFGALDGTGRCDAGIVDAADDDSDISPIAVRKLRVERLLLQKRVAQR